MIPTRQQWTKWSLPSKLTAIGTLLGLVSLLLTVGVMLVDYMTTDDSKSINEKLDQLYTLVHQKQLPSGRKLLIYQTADERYIERYLKPRLADNLDVEAVWDEQGSPSVALVWETHWEGKTSHYRAGVEIRLVSELQSFIEEDEGWKNAILRRTDNVEADGTFNLVNAKSVTLEDILAGNIYEVRIGDYNYDSDDPPSLPLRFTVTKPLGFLGSSN